GVCVGPVNTKTTSVSKTTSAPTTVPTPDTCTPGSSGLGKGDGYKFACCEDQSDCIDDCVKGACVGPVNTKTTSVSKTTSAPTTVPTPDTCTPGSSGLGKGDGYKFACCEDQSDCIDDCVKGVCVGPVNTKTTSVSKTTSAPTTVPTPDTCTPGSSGLGNGDGYKFACCEDQSDCIDDCVKGVCVGPVNTKTTSVSKTTSAPTTVPTPDTCTPGSSGLGKGDGYKFACCEDQSDCIDDCVKGVCVGPVNTKTTSVSKTTSAPTTVPTPDTCTPGSSGLGKGDGYKFACCEDQSDCIDDCVKGACVGPVNTKTAAPSTPTADACITGFFGKGNGKGGNNACCKNQSDCKESCLSGKCGVA
ncbi:hypothetical protein INT48_005618, partial [Thamnidium elegans]